MSTTSIKSRIARHLTLRRLEVTSILATVLAFALTVILVGGTPLEESNLVAVGLIERLGWTGAGVLAVVVEAGIFAGYRRLEPRFPHSALAGGVALAAIGVGDLLINVYGLTTVGLPETMLWAPVVESAGIVAPVGALVVVRPSLSKLREIVAAAPRPPTPSRTTVGVVAIVFLVALSPVLPWLGMGLSGLSIVDRASAVTTDGPDEYFDFTTEPNNMTVEQNSGTDMALSWGVGAAVFTSFRGDNSSERIAYAHGASASSGGSSYRTTNTYDEFDYSVEVQMSGNQTTADGNYQYFEFWNGSYQIRHYWDNGNLESGSSLQIRDNSGNVLAEKNLYDTGIPNHNDWMRAVVSVKSTGGGNYSVEATYYEENTSKKITSINTTISPAQSDVGGYLEFGSHTVSSSCSSFCNSPQIATDNLAIGKSNFPEFGSNINGTVENQNGQPISNATVQLTISKKPSVPQADSQLDTLSNPIPSAYANQLDGDFSLLGDDGFVAQKSGQYAAIYSPSDLGLTYKQSADLRDPKVTSIEPGTEQAIILADTEADCGVAGFETNEYNRQIPGCVQQDGNVTIEKLSSSGEVTSTDEVSVEEAGNQRDFGGPTDIHYASYTFTTGVYRISPPNGTSYLVKAGTPTPDFNQYEQTLENQRTQQAQAMQEALNQDTLVVKTVATNETGHWNASVSSSAKVIAVSARKAPGVDVAPGNLTYDNMSAAYNSDNPPNASVYLPSTTKRVEPGASNVDITLREVAFPSFANIDQLQNRIQQLQNRLNNLSMDDLPQQLLQRLETESAEDLRKTWSSMRGTLVNFEPAREAYLEISDRDSVPTADELSKAELQTAIRNANLAITQSASTAEVSETAAETTQDTISQTWELAGIDVDEANMSVIADYSNGTSRVISDEYVSVNPNVGRADQITVENFPLGADDPAMVNLRLRVAGNNELATASTTVTNPQFTGQAPTIDAVELTSLAPGPNDRVTVEIHPDGSSSFGEVTSMTVYGPAGNELETSNITDGTKASFTTNGEGVHSIRFTVETDTGRQFVDVVQVEASSADEPMRPSIYARSGPLGTYAVVGDGFESGDVELADDGSVEVVGILGSDSDVPSKIDVFTEGLERGTEATTTVRVVQGESRESVRKNIFVVVHGPQLNSPSDGRENQAIAYANGMPVTWDGSTRFGVIKQDGDGSSIHAYTQANGVLRLEVDNTPGFIERQRFWLSQNAPWLPGLGFITGGSTLRGGFVLVRRRRGAGN